MEAYLDNSATTRCSESVRDMMVKVMMEDYGNPSSLHLKGVKAEEYIKQAKERIAKTLKVTEKEILFTSGGTESNNLAIIGGALANQRAGKHLITTAVEHASVAVVMKYLEEQGFEVTYLSVDKNGLISLEELEAAVREDTILVSMMQINNEIGAIEPIEKAAEIIKRKNPKTLVHVDAIQSYGKLRIYPKKMQIDMLSVSGHKLHGPKGVGFLYIKDKTKVKPLILGGGQQKGMRSGTENVPGIAGLGVACEEIYRDFDANIEQMRKVKQAFLQGLENIEGVHVNGLSGEDSAPHIVSVSFEGIDKSEALLHALEDKGIYVSAGSACSSNKPAVSATLKAIGVPEKLLTATLRFSFSVHTTVEEIEYTLQALEELLPFLRKYRSH
ncbi:MAG: cysteine desulfurase family protein [Lachnospiraceae bacterium]